MGKLIVHRKAYNRKPYTRKAYVRKSYMKDVKPGRGVKMKRIASTRVKRTKVPKTHVPASTYKVKDRGAPGRGPKVIPKLKENTLGGKGFFSKSAASRHRKELADARKYGYKKVQGKLSAVLVLNKRTKPSVSQKAKADKHYLAKTIGGKGSYGHRK